MIIYLAGKMTGLPDWGREQFHEAEQALAAEENITVINPALLPLGLPDDRYMPICMAMLDAADAIYMLDGWQDSEGARLELAYAVHQGKRVVREKKSCVGCLNEKRCHDECVVCDEVLEEET